MPFPDFSTVSAPLVHPELHGDKASTRIDRGDLVASLQALYDILEGLWQIISPDTSGDGDPAAVLPGDTFWDILVLAEDASGAAYLDDHYTVDVAETAAWTTGEYITINLVYRFYWGGEAWVAGTPGV